MKLFSFDWPLRTLVTLQLWEIEYFRHLKGEWNVLPIDPECLDAVRVAALSKTFEDRTEPAVVRRGVLVEMEQTLLRHYSANTLIQIAPIIRLRYHDIVGDRQFAAYTPTVLPKCGNVDEAARTVLAEDLSAVLGAIHWRYVMMPFGSRIRISLTFAATCWILFYTALWCGAVFWAHRIHSPFLAMVVTCMLCGLMGGFISALRRMQNIGDDNDSVFVAQGIKAADFWLFFSPLLGGVFAMIALLLCITGLLGGSVLPNFQVPHAAAHDLSHEAWWFWSNLVPVRPEDYAKLFLWCFIAGFAERFIPDMLDSLIRRVDGTQKISPAVNAPILPTTANGLLPGEDRNKEKLRAGLLRRDGAGDHSAAPKAEHQGAEQEMADSTAEEGEQGMCALPTKPGLVPDGEVEAAGH